MPHFHTPQLFLLLILSLFESFVLANVEKAIFLGPSLRAIEESLTTQNDQTTQRWLDLKLSHIHTLTPVSTDGRSSLRTKLNRVFPSSDNPRGQDAWFLLEGLTEGQRYEVRVCWAATQPTNFYLETYTPKQVLTTPSLASSLMEYFPAVSPQPSYVYMKGLNSSAGTSASSPTGNLLLQVSAAADYFTSSSTLMLHPLPVDVDIILDPFLFNVLPRSLVPTIGWIVVVAAAGWAVAKRLVPFLVSISRGVEAEEANEGVIVEESKKER